MEARANRDRIVATERLKQEGITIGDVIAESMAIRMVHGWTGQSEEQSESKKGEQGS